MSGQRPICTHVWACTQEIHTICTCSPTAWAWSTVPKASSSFLSFHSKRSDEVEATIGPYKGEETKVLRLFWLYRENPAQTSRT